MPGELAMMLDTSVQEMGLETSIIIVGVDASGAHIFGIQDPGACQCFDRIGYHAIGIGNRHALLTLVMLKQHYSMDINRTVHNVYESKKQSEMAQGVGQSTEMKIIQPDLVTTIDSEGLNSLEEIHKKRVAPGNKELDEAVEALPFNGQVKRGVST